MPIPASHLSWQPTQHFGPAKNIKMTHEKIFLPNKQTSMFIRECIRILDLRVQVHPGELWVSKQRVDIVLEASKPAGTKGGVPKICEFVHPLHPC